MEDQKRKKIVLLIDGDVVAYAAFPNRWGNSYSKLTEGIPTFTPEEDQEYFTKGVENYHNITTRIYETVFADEVRIAMKGEGNFRDEVFPEYKSRRKSTVRPVNDFVRELRKYAIEDHIATAADGMEADDLLHIWANEILAEGNTPIIGSIDKDLLTIPGLHYRFPKEKSGHSQWNSNWGDTSLIITQPVWDAQLFYHKQILMGDSTDSIPGLPGIGPKKAEAILANCKTLEQLQYMVSHSYKTLIGEGWKEALILTGKLITMLPHRDYVFSLDNWNLVKD
jgi:DNA polymerase-1